MNKIEAASRENTNNVKADNGCCGPSSSASAPKTTERIVGFLSGLKSVWAMMALTLFGVALFDPAQFLPVTGFATGAFLSTLPYIVVAVALIAGLKAAGAENSLADIFKGREYRMIVLAAFVGGLAPFCSCEVIPFIAGLIAAGVPLSAIMAFWLSSPLIDPASLLITAGALGWDFAIAKTGFAVFIGLFGGLTVAALRQQKMLLMPGRPGSAAASCRCGPALGSDKPAWKFWPEKERRQTFWHELSANGIFLTKWLAFAYLLEALLVTYVPASLIGSIVGGQGIFPIFLSALVGAPAYLNSFAAPPLVAGLMEQGMSSGAAMAFMIAGAVSSIPAMVGVYSLVRLEVFLAYVLLGFFGAVLSGLIFLAMT